MKIIINLFFLLFTNLVLASNITIDKPIINFDKNENKSDLITVKNLSEDIAYVKIDLYEIKNSGTSEEKRVLYKQLDMESEEGIKEYNKNKSKGILIKDPSESGIFVSPSKMVIQPKSSSMNFQSVRIINANEDLTEEKIYRLRVYPVISGFENAKNNIAIKVLMGYEALILVQPNNPTFDYSYEINNDKIKFKNNGNSNIKFISGKQCDSNSNCKDLESFRLYPNLEKEITLPYLNKSVNYFLEFGKEKRKVDFK